MFVFAQTLVIDQTTSFDASIYMRARQVIINYEASPEIVFDHNGAEIPYDIAEAVNRGQCSRRSSLSKSTGHLHVRAYLMSSALRSCVH